jgi:hypothetical protein
MKNDVRSDPLHSARDGVEVADIGISRIDYRLDGRRGEQVRLAGDRQRQAEHAGAEPA